MMLQCSSIIITLICKHQKCLEVTITFEKDKLQFIKELSTSAFLPLKGLLRKHLEFFNVEASKAWKSLFQIQKCVVGLIEPGYKTLSNVTDTKTVKYLLSKSLRREGNRFQHLDFFVYFEIIKI